MNTKFYEMVPTPTVSGIKTIFIFNEIPYHYELNAGHLPLLDQGLEVEFDLNVNGIIEKKHFKIHIQGIRRVDRKYLKYCVEDGGLVQYLEWVPQEAK